MMAVIVVVMMMMDIGTDSLYTPLPSPSLLSPNLSYLFFTIFGAMCVCVYVC